MEKDTELSFRRYGVSSPPASMCVDSSVTDRNITCTTGKASGNVEIGRLLHSSESMLNYKLPLPLLSV
jgi:hypothetical protein